MLAITPDNVKNPESMKNYILKTGKFPDLFAYAKLGNIDKTLIWRIRVEETDDGNAIIRIFHGYIDLNYKIDESTLSAEIPKIYTSGKHIGHINETTPYQQAMNEAISYWLDKYKKYDPDPNMTNNSGTVLISPMLALKYEKASKYIKFPCAIQRKYNGVRCVATRRMNGEVHMYSRSMERIIGCEKIRKEIDYFLVTNRWNTSGDMYLDGEIYKHGYSLQKINGIVNRKYDSPDADVLAFHIFDCFFAKNTTMSFKDRNGILSHSFTHSNIAFANLVYVDTFRVNSYPELMNYHMKFISEGYEGTIIRNENAAYTFAKGKSSGRSHDLIKLKTFDDEFVKLLDVIEYDPLKSKFGIVLKVFDEKYGKEFLVNGNGDKDYQRQILEHKKKYIGKLIQIEFLSRTEDFIPTPCYPKLYDGKYIFQ